MGADPIGGKALYVVILFTFIILLLNFNIIDYLNFNFNNIFKHYFFLLLFLLFFISLLFNTQEISNFYYLTRLITFFCYLYLYFHLLPKLFNENPDYFFKFLRYLIGLGTLIGFLGLLMLFIGFSPSATRVGKFVAYANDPNFVAGNFIYCVLSTIYYLINKREIININKKLILFGCLFIQCISLYFTYSRTSIIALLLGFILYTFYIFRKKQLLTVYPFILAILPTVIIKVIQSKGFISVIMRFLLLVPAYYMVNNNTKRLLMGFGVTDAFAEYEKAKLFYNVFAEENINNPHNMFVSLILMFGLIFTVIFVIITFGFIFRCIKKSLHSPRSEKLFVGFVLSVLLGLFYQGLFESQIVQVEYASLQPFLICLGLLYRYKIYNFVPEFKAVNQAI